MAHDYRHKRARLETREGVPRNWREYHGITVGDHASMIAGDVHGTVNFNAVNHEGMSQVPGLHENALGVLIPRCIEIVLNSLHFQGMERYHERPLDNHPGTFNWIFDQRSQLHACDFTGPWSPGRCRSQQVCRDVEADLRRHASRLQTWLQSSDDVFWVQGKAGSGKSTLMKFLFEHEQTRKNLRHWAGGQVTIAAFFFWGAGSSELEKSYLGLLRGLLFHILQQRPELIRLVLPVRWEAVTGSISYKKPWTKSELVTAFELLLRVPETDFRFCFFVDGLDEFDGDHRDLVDAIRSLGKSPAIKICVSSRPWSVFNREYGSNHDLYVALHTLTQHDITMYVNTGLETAAIEIYRADELAQLGADVRIRSEGVFLWVTLAVRDLRRGIEGHDSMKMLQGRLEAYPPELQDFIQHIFDSIDPAYKRFTGRLLLMMLEPEPLGPPALISLKFLEDSFTTEGEYIADACWSPRSFSEIYSLLDQAAVCANKWCRDLLQPIDMKEVKESFKIPVGNSLERLRLQQPRSAIPFYYGDGFPSLRPHLLFGHQTIYQFVKGKAEDETLSEMAGHSFDPRLAWLYTLVEPARCGSGIHDVAYAVWEASYLLTAYHSQGYEQILADETFIDGIQECLRTMDLIGESVVGTSQCSHWTAGQLATHQVAHVKTDRRLLARTPTTDEGSSFVSYLVCLMFPTRVIIPILQRQRESLTELQKQFVLETSLIPHLYQCATASAHNTDDVSCGDHHPTYHYDIINDVIRSGIDVNRPTRRSGCHQSYSVWQLYLLWIHDLFHEAPGDEYSESHCHQSDNDPCDPDTEARLVQNTIEIFRAFLAHGADPFAMISSVDLTECHKRDPAPNKATFLSVADVLEDLRAVCASNLQAAKEQHKWLTTRVTAVEELKKSLNEAYTRSYLASSHARITSNAAAATMLSHRLSR